MEAPSKFGDMAQMGILKLKLTMATIMVRAIPTRTTPVVPQMAVLRHT
jgi:hypothetical protein